MRRATNSDGFSRGSFKIPLNSCQRQPRPCERRIYSCFSSRTHPQRGYVTGDSFSCANSFLHLKSRNSRGEAAPRSKQRNKRIQHVLVEAAKMAPRYPHELALVCDKEMQRWNENRATLAVAWKLAACTLAADRKKPGTRAAEASAGVAVTLQRRIKESGYALTAAQIGGFVLTQ